MYTSFYAGIRGHFRIPWAKTSSRLNPCIQRQLVAHHLLPANQLLLHYYNPVRAILVETERVLRNPVCVLLQFYVHIRKAINIQAQIQIMSRLGAAVRALSGLQHLRACAEMPACSGLHAHADQQSSLLQLLAQRKGAYSGRPDINQQSRGFASSAGSDNSSSGQQAAGLESERLAPTTRLQDLVAGEG